MAKIKSINDGKKAAKPAVIKPGKQNAEPAPKTGEVKAVRDGVPRTFPAALWNNLPKDKEGWQIESDAPKAPKQTGDNSQQGNNQPPAPKGELLVADTTYEDAVKAYAVKFSQAPGQDLSLEDLINLVNGVED